MNKLISQSVIAITLILGQASAFKAIPLAESNSDTGCVDDGLEPVTSDIQALPPARVWHPSNPWNCWR